MSVCIEQQNHHNNNFKQSLPICNDKTLISLLKLQQTLKFWMARSRQRTQLSHLDARILEDIGMTPAQRDKEIAKPFWK